MIVKRKFEMELYRKIDTISKEAYYKDSG